MKEYRKFLEEIGYDTHIVGCNYFVDLLDDVIGMILDEYDESEIREMFPRLCLEYYHFCYEVSRFKYLDELNYFSKNSYRGNDKKELKMYDEDIVSKLIRLGNKYIEVQKEKESTNKKLIKSIM